MDCVVEKAAEIGVHTIVPVVTERSQVRTADKRNRRERIALEAFKQYGRTMPPVIENTLNYDKAVKHNKEYVLGITLHAGSQVSL
jgi:RsmE family RNA methyltransferase